MRNIIDFRIPNELLAQALSSDRFFLNIPENAEILHIFDEQDKTVRIRMCHCTFPEVVNGSSVEVINLQDIDRC